MRKLLCGLLLAGAPALQAQTTHALIITGVPGEPRLAQQFQRDATTMGSALTQRFNAKVTVLSAASSPRSDKTGIMNALQGLAGTTEAGDRVLVILMGHGSVQDGHARFNIPGPDVTAEELAGMLAPLQGRSVAVVLATSASGGFINALKADHRVVVTATRSAAENEEVVFAQFFAKALSEDVADINKDNALSIAEATEYARREVERFYQQHKRLATEHATVTGAGADAFLLTTSARAVANPALQALYNDRAGIEQRIAALRERKSSMTTTAYEAELERFLLELARKNQQIRAAESRP